MHIGIGKTPRFVLAAAILLSAAPAAVAHHSFAAFDTQSQKTVTGTVKLVEWTNPHIWIWLDVTNSQGGVDTFGFEGMSPNYLARRNWVKTTLKPGDKITIDYRPLRDGKNGGMFMTGKLTSGTVLSMTGGPPDR
jgi:Cu/Ag efflux protein CusF